MSHFNWEEFYEVGNHLNNFSKREAYQRSAIGRYYYSCFGPVKDYYETSFRKTLPSDNAHSTLIRTLRHSPFVEEQKLGLKLDNLRINRNYADYTAKEINKNITSESKRDAEEIFLMLKELHKNPLRLMEN